MALFGTWKISNLETPEIKGDRYSPANLYGRECVISGNLQTNSMDLTPYHAKYFAFDLTRRAPAGLDRLSMALFDAAVDLNPHQSVADTPVHTSPISRA